MNAKRSLRRARRRGFSLIEVLFVLMIIGVGVTTVFALFLAGFDAGGQAVNRSYAAMMCQNLLARVECDSAALDSGREGRVFIHRLAKEFYDGGTWKKGARSLFIQNTQKVGASDSDTKDPVAVDRDTDFFWQCRVSNRSVRLEKWNQQLASLSDEERRAKQRQWDQLELDPTSLPQDQQLVLPPGVVEVAVAVYRNWKSGSNKPAMASYRTLLMVDPE